MAEYTKIVELFGLPGCGKTTICQNLKELAEKEGFKVGLISGVSKICTLRHILNVITISDIVLLARWCFTIILKSHTYLRIAVSPYKRMVIYRCMQKYSNYDYVFIEHGVVQSIVSSLYGAKDYNSIIESVMCKRLLEKTDITKFLYCRVPTDVSFKRIRKRNRMYSGRFDQMSDKQLSLILDDQFIQFEHLLDILSASRLRVDTINGAKVPEDCINNARIVLNI